MSSQVLTTIAQTLSLSLRLIFISCWVNEMKNEHELECKRDKNILQEIKKNGSLVIVGEIHTKIDVLEIITIVVAYQRDMMQKNSRISAHKSRL